MLLNYLRSRIGVPYISDLKYTNLWKDALLVMSQDKELCRKFSLYDWQEAVLYITGEELTGEDYEDYLRRLLI